MLNSATWSLTITGQDVPTSHCVELKLNRRYQFNFFLIGSYFTLPINFLSTLPIRCTNFFKLSSNTEKLFVSRVINQSELRITKYKKWQSLRNIVNNTQQNLSTCSRVTLNRFYYLLNIKESNKRNINQFTSFILYWNKENITTLISCTNIKLCDTIVSILLL